MQKIELLRRLVEFSDSMQVPVIVRIVTRDENCVVKEVQTATISYTGDHQERFSITIDKTNLITEPIQ